MKTYQDIKSAATIDAIIHYVEPLLDIRFKRIKKIGIMHHAHSTLTPKRVSWCMSIKVVSTLGSYLIPEAAAILKCLDIEHYIVAYNWDELGRNGIERIAAKTGGWVYYL